MSDNPTRSFKDFIGWAFAGGAIIILSLVTMIYSSLSADVGRIDARTQVQGERIKGTEGSLDSIRDTLREIKEDVRWLKQAKIDELKKR